MSGTKEDITTAELTSGVRIPLIGLGTWPLAGEDATAAVAQAIEGGYRHIDTAENYANEAAVGEGIRRSGIERSQLFLTTKFNTEWHSRDGVREAFGHAVKRLAHGLSGPVPGALAQPGPRALRRSLRGASTAG